MDWSPLQQEAINKVLKWIDDPDAKQVFRLFGWAGTGKSTLAMHLAKLARGNVCYAAYTGKAALVMRRRGCHGATTIHSLIYIPEEDERTHEITWHKNGNSPLLEAKLLIIDEVSMVNEELALDLMGFGVKILVLGDPFQLPPIEGSGYFTQAEPDVMLTEIHRQASDSDIITLSMAIRTGKRQLSDIKTGDYNQFKIRNSRSINDMINSDQVLCGTHKTRVAVNNAIRMEKGYPFQKPTVGDKIVCLRNNHDKHLLNGQMWVIDKIRYTDENNEVMILNLHNEDEPEFKVTVKTHIWFFQGREEQFLKTPQLRKMRKQYDEFTFGYAITVHKAQGSQWNHVYLIDESRAWSQSSPEDVRKHVYTGITRAAETITIVR